MFLKCLSYRRGLKVAIKDWETSLKRLDTALEKLCDALEERIRKKSFSWCFDCCWRDRDLAARRNIERHHHEK